MKKFLGRGGVLAAALPSFEVRDEQIAMAKAVNQVLEAEKGDKEYGDVLLVEAETGTGKTLAYLLPAVLSGKKVVISTATIPLQDQILNKEIPILQRALGHEFPVVCVKGRQNYLCLYRWYQYRVSRQGASASDDIVDKIEAWLDETETGDRAELAWLDDSSSFWSKISAHSQQCLGSECPDASLCFVNELRKKAGAARLVVVNHHLFFSDLALRQRGYGEVLPRYEAVVFDEAHHIENIASTFFGKTFSHYQILDCVGDIERQAEADLPPSLGDAIIAEARGLKERTEGFSLLFPAQRGRFPLADFIAEHPGWMEHVQTLLLGIERLAMHLERFEAYGDVWKNLQKRVHDLGTSFDEITSQKEGSDAGNFVYWYEVREKAIFLSATPIHVASLLGQTLFRNVDCCVLTSATLTSAGDFSYIFKRLGLHEETKTLKFPSPFNYVENCRIYIPPSTFPLPQEREYNEHLYRDIQRIIMATQGRALVLCTSFRGMEGVAAYLEDRVKFPLLVQGRGSRKVLLERFRSEYASVLVAVASFWEGVDIPGESLSCVIIDKLPFDVPSDPVLQARIAHIQESGGNPFIEFQVPRAILTLRQGVGRLLRSKNDRGVIAIMDTRLYKKGYGRLFRASLPPAPVVRDLNHLFDFFTFRD